VVIELRNPGVCFTKQRGQMPEGDLSLARQRRTHCGPREGVLPSASASEAGRGCWSSLKSYARHLSSVAVHIVGNILGGRDFGPQPLYCTFALAAGPGWTLLDGVPSGRTQTAEAEPVRA
jgi:hypothetical protein